jgi:hypothetical protein
MKLKTSFVLAVGLLASAACAPSRGPDGDARGASANDAKLSRPMSEGLTRKYRGCSVDSDCVYALNGCCDCANGGEDIAVNREQAAAFQARFQCSGACNEMGGDCEQGTARCENRLCTYR